LREPLRENREYKYERSERREPLEVYPRESRIDLSNSFIHDRLNTSMNDGFNAKAE